MKCTINYDENGVPIITPETLFRPDESVFIQISSDFPDFIGVSHKHEFIEVVYVISGTALHETTANSYMVSKGDVIVINYDTPHAFYEQKSDEPFKAYDLMFTLDFFDVSLVQANTFNELFSSFLFYALFPEQKNIGPDIHLSGSRYHMFGDIFNKIYLEFVGRQKGYLEMIRAYMIELITKMFREIDAAPQSKISDRQKEVVAKVIAYLQKNYHMHITLEEVAMHIFLSKDYLNRIFREEVGLPINAFLQKLRVEEACRLLVTTRMTTTDVAIACGFGDNKSFYSKFKRTMHMTPGEYRARNYMKSVDEGDDNFSESQ